MKVSAREAAELLGVSRMQISRLAAAGEFKSERFGNALQIDLESLQRYRELRPGRGRPLEPDAAWKMLIERNRDEAPGDLDELHRLAIEVRRRAERREMRVLPGSMESFLADSAVVLSGAAAAAQHGAAVQDRPPHQVYVRDSDLGALARRHGLREVESDPNLIVRGIPEHAWPLGSDRIAPLLVALVDLVDERDDRSAAEAIRAFV